MAGWVQHPARSIQNPDQSKVQCGEAKGQALSSNRHKVNSTDWHHVGLTSRCGSGFAMVRQRQRIGCACRQGSQSGDKMVLSGGFQNHLHREPGQGNGGAEQEWHSQTSPCNCLEETPSATLLTSVNLAYCPAIGVAAHPATGQPARVSSPKGQ